MAKSFFDSLKAYVGFTETSSERLRAFHPVAQPHFAPIIDDFYGAIQAHPEASAAITGGDAQIARLKQTLVRWLETLLLGPHEEAYFQMRARIGRVHVRINLPQAFMFTAMNRIRVRLLAIAREELNADPEILRDTADALHQILDLELAVMLETYREDMMTKNRMAERLATIGQFAASIGHELRNPLGVIESSLFLLRQHLGPTSEEEKVRKHLDRIAAEVYRSNKTIHDLLELARNRPPRRVRAAVAQIVASSLEAAALPRGIEAAVAIPDGLTVDADPDQLQQILVNLLANAAHALGGVGHVWIEAGQERGLVSLRVRDDGPGVPRELRHRIFEALFTTRAKGSGLGLALCRRIADAHGGTIELEPTDRGASFVVTLPVVAPESTDAPETR